jgi:hypothetical protein
MQSKFGPLICLLLAISVSACGGEDTESPPPPSPAEGLWHGSTNTGRTVTGLVLDDGTYWFLYSLVGNPSVIAGGIQGSGSGQDGRSLSSNGKDFNLQAQAISTVSILGNYVPKQTMNAAVTYINGVQVVVTAIYDPDYDLTPDMSLLAGTYSGSAATAGGIETVTGSLSATGSIVGSSTSGCNFNGLFAPRPRGNVYDVSITFSGGICSNGTSTVNGVGFFDASSKKLFGAALNSTRTNGFLFTGTKP